MGATHTEARILKLLARGLSPESIARKIGRPSLEGVAMVLTAARRRATLLDMKASYVDLARRKLA